MIATKLADFPFDDATRARLRAALAWIKETDMPALEPGRHDIDGDNLYANVMSVTTSAAADKSFEAHHRYVDVHYVIEGEEMIGVAPVVECPALQEFNDADDFCLYGDPAEPERITWTLLREGELCVTPPADAHKPACCVSSPKPLKKVCVKVLVG